MYFFIRHVIALLVWLFAPGFDFCSNTGVDGSSVAHKIFKKTGTGIREKVLLRKGPVHLWKVPDYFSGVQRKVLRFCTCQALDVAAYSLQSFFQVGFAAQMPEGIRVPGNSMPFAFAINNLRLEIVLLAVPPYTSKAPGHIQFQLL